MKKTRSIALILAILMLILCLTGCGKKNNPSSGDQPNTTEPVVTDEPADVIDLVPDSMSPYTIADAVLEDNDYLTVTVSRITDDSKNIALNLSLANKTDDDTIWFAIQRVTVNGCEFDLAFADSVDPGEEKDAKMQLSHDMLSAPGMLPVDELLLSVVTYSILQEVDEQNLTPDIFVANEVVIYPTGKSPNDIQNAERAEQAEDIVVSDDKSGSFVITGIERGEDKLVLSCYITNRSEHGQTVYLEDVTVNDVACDPYWGTHVNTGRQTYSDIVFLKSVLDDADIAIDDVEKINFKLIVYDEDDWLDPFSVEKEFEIII